MSIHNQMTSLLLECLEQLNTQLPNEKRQKISADVALSGSGSDMDSMDLVNFIVAVEQAIEDRFHTEIPLLQEQDLGSEESPFRTISSLSAYAAHLLEQKRSTKP